MGGYLLGLDMAKVTDAVVEVISPEILQSRVAELGREISTAYATHTPVLVGVLNGSVPFLADLSRSIDCDIEIDFLALNRFGEGGKVRIAFDTSVDLTNRHVILVEDIVDTGLTLVSVRALLGARNPASLATVTLLDKSARRLVDVPVEYRGFEIGDEFILGYGLDWEGRYRNLAGMWAVMDLAAFSDDPTVLTGLALRPPGVG